MFPMADVYVGVLPLILSCWRSSNMRRSGVGGWLDYRFSMACRSATDYRFVAGWRLLPPTRNSRVAMFRGYAIFPQPCWLSWLLVILKQPFKIIKGGYGATGLPITGSEHCCCMGLRPRRLAWLIWAISFTLATCISSLSGSGSWSFCHALVLATRKWLPFCSAFWLFWMQGSRCVFLGTLSDGGRSLFSRWMPATKPVDPNSLRPEGSSLSWVPTPITRPP